MAALSGIRFQDSVCFDTASDLLKRIIRRLQQLLCSMLVFPECVPGREKENCLDEHESGIDPAYVACWPDGDSVADPRDGGGDAHVGVKLVVNIMDFDQQPIGIDFARES